MLSGVIQQTDGPSRGHLHFVEPSQPTQIQNRALAGK